MCYEGYVWRRDLLCVMRDYVASLYMTMSVRPDCETGTVEMGRKEGPRWGSIGVCGV